MEPPNDIRQAMFYLECAPLAPDILKKHLVDIKKSCIVTTKSNSSLNYDATYQSGLTFSLEAHICYPNVRF